MTETSEPGKNERKQERKGKVWCACVTPWDSRQSSVETGGEELIWSRKNSSSSIGQRLQDTSASFSRETNIIMISLVLKFCFNSASSPTSFLSNRLMVSSIICLLCFCFRSSLFIWRLMMMMLYLTKTQVKKKTTSISKKKIKWLKYMTNLNKGKEERRFQWS